MTNNPPNPLSPPLTFKPLFKDGKTHVLEWRVSLDCRESGCSLIVKHGVSGGKLMEEWIGFPSRKEAETEASRRYNKKVNREGYTPDLTVVIQPMLALPFEEHGMKLPDKVFIQPKLDGIRCLATKEGLLSRRADRITSLPHIEEALSSLPEGVILDGELYRHGWDFQEHLSAIKRDNASPASLKVRYWVYDIICDLPYRIRYEMISKLVDKTYYTHLIPNELIGLNKVKDYLNYHPYNEYEGVILRDPKPGYIQHRTPSLQKLKRFDQEEYCIVDTTAATRGREKDCIIFICATKEGSIFKVRPKMPLEKRRLLYMHKTNLKGFFCKVEFQGYSTNGIPRQPIGLAYSKDKAHFQ